MSAEGASKTPREELGAVLYIAPGAGGQVEATLENHFGAAQEGDLLARCALAALGASPRTRVVSMRADWLAPAPPDVPIALRAEALGRDGGCLEVRASAGAEICRATCWLAPPGGGLAYQDAAPPRHLPEPESLPSTVQYARKEGWPEAYAAGPVEFRRVGPLRPDRAAGESVDHVVWLKLRAPLPDDPRLGQAALVFLASFYAHWEFERRIGERFDYDGLRILSQSVQLHGALRPQEWMLLWARSRVAAGGRALGARELFARDGALLATAGCEACVQER